MTRSLVDADRIVRLMEGIGGRATGSGRVYLVGGSSAVLVGWRNATVDADIKLDPEPAAVFEAIALLKDELDMNVELAAPDQFVPPLPGWRERSPFIARYGAVDFFHYDFYGQALAKIERGHSTDLGDVQAMVGHDLIDLEELVRLFERVSPDLLRYPAIDEQAIRAKARPTTASWRGSLPGCRAMKPTDGVPGHELVETGLADLMRGELTVEALLVAVGAPRLRALGLPVPETPEVPSQPEVALYNAIGRLHPEDAYSRYNGLIRRLVSYERELERRRFGRGGTVV